MEQEIYQLIVAYFEKTISDDGLTALQEWIETDPEHMDMFSETIEILGATKSYFKPAAPSGKSWARIQAHISSAAEEPAPLAIEEKKNSFKLQWLACAAAAVIISVISFLWLKKGAQKDVQQEEYAQISNPDGQHSMITLPDSSVVYLGGGSKIRYAKNFMGTKRIVELDGEAFFDVVHQARRPFLVKSGEITTVVLGTSFNVKAFAQQERVAVTVRTGKVGVMAMVNGKSQLVRHLLPDEQVTINTKNGLYTFNAINAAAVSGWVNNELIFHDTPLNEITTAIGHHYGVQIEFTNADLGASRLTAKFKNIPLKQVLGDLTALTGLAYTQKGKHIFISKNNQGGGRIMK